MEKTNFKKLVSLSLAAMLCTSVPAISANSAFATDGEPAGGGEPVPVEDNSFVVEETAAIRVSDPAGMRFYANIGADLVDDVQSADEFGFLIFPHAYLAEDENAGKADWQVKGIDGNAEYGLWDYVKVSTTEMDGLIYQRETDGKYCVNGVLHTVVDETMEFAAIAYYVKDGETVYADFNEDFSRSLSYVAKWAYVSEPDKRTAIKSTFKWLETDEFTINSGKELQKLSDAVSEDNTLEGLTFTLSRTIAVIDTYKAVPKAFAGTFNYGDYAILVVDNEVGKAFESDTYNVPATETMAGYMSGVKALTSKLVDAETTTFWTTSGDADTTRPESVEVTAENAEQQANYCNYTGAIAGYSSTGSSGTLYLSVKTNDWHVPSNKHQYDNQDARSKWELEAMKEWYSSIDVYMFCSTQSLIVKGRYTVLPWTTNYYIAHGYWQKLTFPIDEVMEVCYTRGGETSTGIAGTTVGDGHNGSTLLPLVRATKKKATMIYVGDCVFAK